MQEKSKLFIVEPESLDDILNSLDMLSTKLTALLDDKSLLSQLSNIRSDIEKHTGSVKETLEYINNINKEIKIHLDKFKDIEKNVYLAMKYSEESYTILNKLKDDINTTFYSALFKRDLREMFLNSLSDIISQNKNEITKQSDELYRSQKDLLKKLKENQNEFKKHLNIAKQNEKWKYGLFLSVGVLAGVFVSYIAFNFF